MKPITVSINPTYLCNFRCNFCYLTPEQLADRETVPIEIINERLREITKYTQIDHVDIYGGEVSTLTVGYSSQLISTIRNYYTGTINIVTNFLNRAPLIDLDANVSLSVSYDFNARERHERVYERLLKEQSHPLHILILATPEVIAMDVDKMITELNRIPLIETVEIKPYSSNQSNQLAVSNQEYEKFVQSWISSPTHKEFILTNEQQLTSIFHHQHNSFSDDHIYITPTGKFAVLEFDLNDREFFKPVDTFDDYITWTIEEKQRTYANSVCNTCDYLGRCFTEHIRNVKSVNESCDGHYKLIEWYKHERMEN